jgi:hypothetical protein
MSEQDINILVKELLQKGDIKCYSDEGSLVSLSESIGQDTENDVDVDYIKTIEHDFREDADDILKKLELSHLRALAMNKSH